MALDESQDEKRTRVAKELGAALRRQAAGTWKRVKTMDRDEVGGHAWKFKPGPEADLRFLRVSNEAMDQPVPQLLAHLKKGKWLDRLDGGDETSLVLEKDGRLRPAAER